MASDVQQQATRATPPGASPATPSLAFIRARLDAMSAAERKIAKTVLDAPEEALSQSITELADRAGVSEATVSRFCRHLKLRGFADLRIRIAQELAPGAVKPDPLAAVPGPEWLRAAALRATSMIEQTATLLDPAALARAIELLTGARKVNCYGQGASGVTALDAAHHFINIGMLAEAHSDAHIQTMTSALLRPEDVAVAFSRTGSTKDVAACLRLARARGVPVISVTSSPRSPIARLSDVVLHVAAEGTILGNLQSKIVQLFVLELLVEGCANALGSSALEAADRVTGVMLDKLY